MATIKTFYCHGKEGTHTHTHKLFYLWAAIILHQISPSHALTQHNNTHKRAELERRGRAQIIPICQRFTGMLAVTRRMVHFCFNWRIQLFTAHTKPVRAYLWAITERLFWEWRGSLHFVWIPGLFLILISHCAPVYFYFFWRGRVIYWVWKAVGLGFEGRGYGYLIICN